MSINNSKTEGPQSVGQIVSRSVKQQNKYLFNYIHNLEFLITKTQKERANYDLKFKKLVSHIRHGFTNKNIMSEKLNRALKVIGIMTAEDIMEYSKKEIASSGSKDDSILRQLLSSTSKSLNYVNQGYASDIKSGDGRPPALDDMNRPTIGSLNILSQVNWLDDGKFMCQPTQIQNPLNLTSLNKIAHQLNMSKPNEGESEQTDTGSQVIDDNLETKSSKERMKLEWRRIPNLIVHESKRKQKHLEKERELKLKHTMSQSITTHHAYHNEAISNIESQMGEMMRRNTAPLQDTQNQMPVNGASSTSFVPNQGAEAASNGYNGYQNNYAHHGIDLDQPNGYYQQKVNQSRTVQNDELFMISKKLKQPNGDVYPDNFDFDDPNMGDLKRKGKKRGRKSKKAVTNEF